MVEIITEETPLEHTWERETIEDGQQRSSSKEQTKALHNDVKSDDDGDSDSDGASDGDGCCSLKDTHENVSRPSLVESPGGSQETESNNNTHGNEKNNTSELLLSTSSLNSEEERTFLSQPETEEEKDDDEDEEKDNQNEHEHEYEKEHENKHEKKHEKNNDKDKSINEENENDTSVITSSTISASSIDEETTTELKKEIKLAAEPEREKKAATATATGQGLKNELEIGSERERNMDNEKSTAATTESAISSDGMHAMTNGEEKTAAISDSVETGKMAIIRQRQPERSKMKRLRKRKNGRLVRSANIDEKKVEEDIEENNQTAESKSSQNPRLPSTVLPPLPPNHYEATLHRRAIRKEKEGVWIEQKTTTMTPTTITSNNPLQAGNGDKNNEEEESYGDTSLGMKIIILEGKVIIQALNSLSDGRASPAQLTGTIRRGDAIVRLEGVKLVNVPLERLIEALKPLSTPDEKSGCYQRNVKMRLASGGGLYLLNKSERKKQQQTKRQELSANTINQVVANTNELLSFFPLDQFGGISLSENPILSLPAAPESAGLEEQNEQERQQKIEEISKMKLQVSTKTITTMKNTETHEEKQCYSNPILIDNLISQSLATSRKSDKERFVSSFFTLANEGHSDILCHCLLSQIAESNVGGSEALDIETLLQKRARMLSLGKRAVLGAYSIGQKMEAVDQFGNERKNQSSSKSLRSYITSTRENIGKRKRQLNQYLNQHLEVASLPTGVPMSPKRKNDGDSSEDSDGADFFDDNSEEKRNKRRIILALAAHDDLWKQRVLKELQTAIDGMRNDDNQQQQRQQHPISKQRILGMETAEETNNECHKDEENKINFDFNVDDKDKDNGETNCSNDKNNTLSDLNEFGNFMFGEEMSKIVLAEEKKNPKILPTGDVTSVLFDLASNLPLSSVSSRRKTNTEKTMPETIHFTTQGKSSTAVSASRKQLPLSTIMENRNTTKEKRRHQNNVCAMSTTANGNIGRRRIRKKNREKQKINLATNFIMGQAFPLWLESFLTLPWSERRVLWSTTTSNGSTNNNDSTYDDDGSLTVDSYSLSSVVTGSGSTASSLHSVLFSNNITKNTNTLREQIENQELNAETKTETCFLVTFYFTQALLPELFMVDDGDYAKKEATAKITKPGQHVQKINGQQNFQEKQKEIIDFVKRYGSYLNLHECLLEVCSCNHSSALLRNHNNNSKDRNYDGMDILGEALVLDGIVSVLLELAEHDPMHQKAMKQMLNKNSNLNFSFILYDETFLSAVIKCLHGIRKEVSADRRLTIIHTCVSAYPDVLPWQVRSQCLFFNFTQGNNNDIYNDDNHYCCSKDELKDLYYKYLSLLLHPSDGHDSARNDGGLVEEWCVLSLQQQSPGRRGVVGDASSLLSSYRNGNINKEQEPIIDSLRNNFYCVANSSNRRLYHRDLVMLLKLSMTSREYSVALDLISEILEKEGYNLGQVQHSNDKNDRSSGAIIGPGIDGNDRRKKHKLVLKSLRTLASSTLDEDEWPPQNDESTQILKRSMQLFRKMATPKLFRTYVASSSSLSSNEQYSASSSTNSSINSNGSTPRQKYSNNNKSISVADELYSLLRCKENNLHHRHRHHGENSMSSLEQRHQWNQRQVTNFLHFLASEAPPIDVLETLSSYWAKKDTNEDESSPSYCNPNDDDIAVLQTILQRGARASTKNELSGSLVRIRRARCELDHKLEAALTESVSVTDKKINIQKSNPFDYEPNDDKQGKIRIQNKKIPQLNDNYNDYDEASSIWLNLSEGLLKIEK